MILRVGDSGSVINVVTEIDIDAFRTPGDFNRIHMDEEYAKGTPFGGRVAHGALTVGWASAVLASEMPGPGCVLVEISMKFLSPVRIGDVVTVTATVSEIMNPKRVRVVLRCKVDDRIVASGWAVVVPPDGVDVEEPDSAIMGIFEGGIFE